MFILGGYQSDFARHLSREGREIADLVGELVDGALGDAGLEPRDIDVIHVGNAFGQLFNLQGQLGAMPATIRPAFWGIPAMRHEAACASGSIAILSAMAGLAAGHYETALVIGVEQERNVPGEVAAKYLGAAAWTGHEGQDARYLWPSMFSKIGEVMGARREHLDAIAAKNFANAKTNPNAQTRTWAIDLANNPIVEGMLGRHDCAQVTDGGAALVISTKHRGKARIAGWGLRTVGLALEQKLARRGELLFPHVADAVNDARRRAGAPTIDGYEVHDCFTTTEYMAIDHLGLAPPGEAHRAIDDGRFACINASGGLIGGGHPVGATGVRMALDAAKSGKTIQTLNLGGSATTVASLVVTPAA